MFGSGCLILALTLRFKEGECDRKIYFIVHLINRGQKGISVDVEVKIQCRGNLRHNLNNLNL